VRETRVFLAEESRLNGTSAAGAATVGDYTSGWIGKRCAVSRGQLSEDSLAYAEASFGTQHV